MKCGASPDFRLHPDSTACSFHNSLADRQAQTAAGMAVGALQTLGTLKDLRMLTHIYTAAVFLHGKRRVRIVSRLTTIPSECTLCVTPSGASYRGLCPSADNTSRVGPHFPDRRIRGASRWITKACAVTHRESTRIKSVSRRSWGGQIHVYRESISSTDSKSPNPVEPSASVPVPKFSMNDMSRMMRRRVGMDLRAPPSGSIGPTPPWRPSTAFQLWRSF